MQLTSSAFPIFKDPVLPLVNSLGESQFIHLEYANNTKKKVSVQLCAENNLGNKSIYWTDHITHLSLA